MTHDDRRMVGWIFALLVALSLFIHAIYSQTTPPVPKPPKALTADQAAEHWKDEADRRLLVIQHLQAKAPCAAAMDASEKQHEAVVQRIGARVERWKKEAGADGYDLNAKLEWVKSAPAATNPPPANGPPPPK